MMLVTLLAILGAAAASAQPLKVYVFTAAGAHGFVDEELKARRDTVADVRKAIAHKRHASAFVLVDTAEAADMQLEVAWRGKLTTDQATGSTVWVPVRGVGVATSSASAITQDNIRLVMTVRDYRKEFWGLEPGKLTVLGHVPQMFWGDLAQEAVKGIAEWARENDAQLRTMIRPKE